MGHKIKPTVCEGCKVPKGWGEEIIIENNEMYCGKLLIFKKGCRFSMHYHLIKDETWYVDKGEFIYKWIDTETAELHEQKLKVGDVVRQRVGQPHQIEALTDGTIFEYTGETTITTLESYQKAIQNNEFRVYSPTKSVSPT